MTENFEVDARDAPSHAALGCLRVCTIAFVRYSTILKHIVYRLPLTSKT
jgi:hypothetical protein